MRYTVTTPDDLLRLLMQFNYLTIVQITRFLDKEKTRTNIREKLRRLVKVGLVEIDCLPRRNATGGAMPYIYSLTRKGRRALGSNEQAQNSFKSSVAMAHTLAINQVAILAFEAVRQEPRLSIYEWQHESRFQKGPIQLSEGRCLIPDLFVSFALSPPYGKVNELLGLIFEIDCNTENKEMVQEKILHYIEVSAGPYQKYTGLSSLTVVFITADGGERRAKRLLAWAEETLKEMPEAADLFLFGSINAATALPLSFFCDAHFLSPFRSGLVQLIEKTWL